MQRISNLGFRVKLRLTGREKAETSDGEDDAGLGGQGHRFSSSQHHQGRPQQRRCAARDAQSLQAEKCLGFSICRDVGFKVQVEQRTSAQCPITTFSFRLTMLNRCKRKSGLGLGFIGFRVLVGKRTSAQCPMS